MYGENFNENMYGENFNEIENVLCIKRKGFANIVAPFSFKIVLYLDHKNLATNECNKIL